MTTGGRIGVLGMGTMGRGIIEVFLTAGYEVACVEVSQEVVQSSTRTLKNNLRKSREKGRISEDPEELLARLSVSQDHETFMDLSFAVEAVFEDLEEKKKALSKLEEALDPGAVIATNTSSLSITKLSWALNNPSRLVGMHFFNPAPRMPLVEVVRGENTAEKALSHCVDLVRRIGKTPVVVNDSPGFVVNRLLIPYLMAAGKLLDQGVASAEDIDTCMKLGAGHPMGPFELSDLIGIDIVVDIAKELGADCLDEERYEIPAAFTGLLSQGRLGRKTKRGFFEY